MSTNTYVELNKTVTSGSATTVTWTSIPSTYTDLVIVGYCKAVSPGGATFLRFQNDSTGIYGRVRVLGGSGAGTSSVAVPNETKVVIDAPNTDWSNFTAHVQNYSSSATFKTAILRGNSSDYVTATIGTYRSTSPITIVSLTIDGGSFVNGSTFSLYGIKAWSDETTPKATGGYVYSDSSYWYHAFPFSGTFTPNQSLTCDYVVVAGGGGAGGSYGGGGGAGGLRYATSQTLSATGYSVTIGAGGLGQINYNGAAPTAGSATSFNSINTTGGGRGGIFGSDPGGGGGSAGGGRRTASSGTAGNAGGYTPVEGYAGGGAFDGGNYGSGGGGGAGQAGVTGTSTAGGTGGNGFSSSLITAIVSATGIGELVSGTGYLAGGGGGGTYDGGTFGQGGYGGGGNSGHASSSDVSLQNGANGDVNTGSGGGGGCYSNVTGTNFNGGNGASGVVIVRYAK
jgi:hypothetical protein